MPEREHPRPPRLAAWLVRLAVPGRWREALLGDLVEDFHAALDAGMPIGDARRAFWRAACRSTLDAGRARRWLLASTIDHDADTTARPTGDPLMIALAHDLRLAWRSLRRAPGFTTVVVLTLALGIGCLAAFWSLFDGVLLQPLPYAEPDRLVQVWGHHVERPDGRWNSSYPDVVDLRDGATAFEQITVYQPTHANLVRDGAPPERLATTFVSANFFRLLGLSPTLGRELGEADERGEASPSVVLGEALWRRAFGADPEILGRVVQVDGVPRTIVGVAPADLTFPTRTELWMPVSALASIDVRGVHSLKVIGRLATGASLARADDEAATVAARLRVDHPSSKAQFDWRVEPLHESVAGFVRPRLTLVAGAATLLLLIVCANVSSLLLERAQRRGREVATRAALGASVGQLARGFFAEAAWLVAAGAVGGVAVAALGRRWLLAHGPALPRAIDPALDERTLAMILMASLAIGGLLTLVPAMQLLGRNLARRLGAGVLGTAGRRRGRWRAAFVVGQIALAVVLTLGAALLAESLRRLYAVDPGFDPRGVLTVDLEVSTPYVSDAWPDTVAFYEALIERVEGLPGVVSAAAAHHHAAEPGWSTSFTIEGEPAPEEGYEPEANFRPVTAGYFDTIGLPLLHGRPIDDRIRSEGPGQAVVNQAFVDHYLPEGEALGRVLLRDNWWNDAIDRYTIIGIVSDSRFAGRTLEPRPAMYFAHSQEVPPAMTLLVKVAEGLDPLAQLDGVREAIWAIDPEMPLGQVSTLETLLGDRLTVRRFVTWLLGLFAAVALGLAALGLYGVLAYATSQRTRELGLRMALGARAGDLRGLVLGQGVRLAAVGLTVGLATAWAATRLIEAMLFGIERGDPTAFGAVALLLGLVTLAAGWLPAWRATRVDPCRALADE